MDGKAQGFARLARSPWNKMRDAVTPKWPSRRSAQRSKSRIDANDSCRPVWLSLRNRCQRRCFSLLASQSLGRCRMCVGVRFDQDVAVRV